jgi:hypothetical protein
VKDPQSLFAELAVPRAVGSSNQAAVRAVLRRELEARGFIVMEHRFLARASVWLRGTTPTEAVNLIAVRPRTRVTLWLTAHYDSKQQPLSMLGRLVLGGLVLIQVVNAILSSVIGHANGGTIAWVHWAVTGVLGVAFLALNRVGDGSPGAVDNATGLLTVLTTIDALPATLAAGVMFFDAEEWGLVGARALARERSQLLADTVVVNIDSIDDRGAPTVLVHRGGPNTDRVATALGSKRWRGLPVFVDGRALAHTARECCTIMRGDWRTMGIIHRPADGPNRLSLAGVREVSQRLAGALTS